VSESDHDATRVSERRKGRRQRMEQVDCHLRDRQTRESIEKITRRTVSGIRRVNKEPEDQ